MLTKIIYTIKDGKKQEAELIFYTYEEVTIPDLQVAARDLLPVVRNIITGGITDCRIVKEMNFAPLYASFPALRIPDPASDVEEGAILHFVNQQDDGGSYKPRFPTFDESLLFDGTREIDLDDARMQALANGILGESYVTNHEYALEALTDGKEKFVRRVYRKRKAR